MAKFQFIKDYDGNIAPTVIEVPVNASQDIYEGDLLILSSNKASLAGASSATVLGVAAERSDEAAAGTMIKVYLIKPSQVWRATADADASAIALGAKLYDINATTQTVDVADATNGCIFVWRTRDSVTDVEISFSSVYYG